jgi:hypothetical protein
MQIERKGSKSAYHGILVPDCSGSQSHIDEKNPKKTNAGKSMLQER